ncbi:protein MODIFIER OF SNC1 11 isoform X2 [Manihot esculenta]|uniref:Uncharacterized protein n=1 Tax=Manihot esculenta TaxID=3983 RepID=A0ACB7H773_MANES|nr:protein MODIFIER OF SNC1 11 isoform X2 [Manihot esculenta]KAG8648442.1 hypothetical protein MANES_08G001000v8 [Manihot esculenta]
MATDTENLTTTATPTLQDNPTKTLDATVPASAVPERLEDSTTISPSVASTDATKDGDSKSSKGTAVASRSGDTAPVSDTEKKIRRAERFGITVQLSEEEKRNSRAERFGTGVALKTSEEQKRKARAERFALPVTSDEEAKKKARLERFAPTSKTVVLEEGKRNSQELQPSPNSPKMNGKGNIEPAAIAGKAGGGS